ncbi:fumarylacetoacetate hydrolase family protein [Piscinibacter sakaiensis]|uniref:fumarylacetoacetate hydrolase family protein n=1 Tax=Piscinibacter sakaiensis TaxID=1547922 RepID=UPI003AB030B1
MTMIDDVTSRLVDARNRRQVVSAAGVDLPDTDTAYAVQQAVAERLGWFADAWPPRHWKSGGPSRDVVLTHAPLPPAGVWQSPAAAGDWPFQMRCIEAEIALRLAVDVDQQTALALDVARAEKLIDAMCVSIEIVDSRWTEGLQAPVLARLADSQLHGALVLGDWVPFQSLDWSAQRCKVRIGDQPATEHRGSHALGDPCFLLPTWLRHVTRDGDTVAAGTVVTTGTWIGLVPAAAGDLVSVEFPGVGSASVQL